MSVTIIIVNQNALPANFSLAKPKATSADESTAPIVERITMTSELLINVVNE
jgi:hypothetical protein